MRNALDKTLRGQLEKVVTEGRKTVEKVVREEIQRLGVAEAKSPSYLSPDDAKLRTQLRAHGRTLGDVKTSDGSQQTEHLVNEVAYEHWHRMIFAYFLEQNELLMFEGYSLTLADCAEAATELGARNGWEAAGQLAADMLPQVFRRDSPALKVALPIDALRRLEALIKSLAPETFQAQDALGWLYQFWQSERKEAVNQSGVKIGADELSPVTQLFTEPYMVSFLLDNALGAWWANRKLTRNDLTTTTTEAELRKAAAIPGVPLDYLRFVKADAEQPPSEENPWQPAAGRFEQWPDSLSELSVMDPCCGSGHFLVAVFLMLVPLRMSEEGLTAKQAVDAVLSQNLHGLELDQRCVELAAFALALEAWRYPDESGRPLGYRKLPELHLACSGVAIGAAKGEWKQLAKQITESASQGDKPERAKNLSIALDWLQQTFQHAPVLGSLINPSRSDAAKIVNWPDLEQALSKALEGTGKDYEAPFEAQVAAQGLTKAAQLLNKQYGWVITNVPYLVRGKQSEVLKKYCEKHHPAAKNDLATVFLDRCLEICEQGGTSSIVLPQNWLFLTSYKKFREKLIRNDVLHLIARLGPQAFQTPMWDFNVQLITLSSGTPAQSSGGLFGGLDQGNQIHGLDVSEFRTAAEKSAHLLTSDVQSVNQTQQLDNPGSIVQLNDRAAETSFAEFASCFQGTSTGDNPRFVCSFWELGDIDEPWQLMESVSKRSQHFGGKESIINWESVNSFDGAAVRGWSAFQNKGVAIGQMAQLPSTLYLGQRFPNTTPTIVSKQVEHLAAIWVFCASDSFSTELRKINQKLSVDNGYVGKIPFDFNHWTAVAKEKYPNGLPKPYANDPTQWIFHGHPCGSVLWDEDSKRTANGGRRLDYTVLQIAIARLLGYRWPAEHDAEMELAEEQREWLTRCEQLSGDLVDDDGIVCLPALRGEGAASYRLELMLEAAYGDSWSPAIRDQLLASVGAKSLEVWLRDKFFEQHCKLFQNRPFIWQIWDGLKDGFSALVNYHKLDSNALDRLIYTYLNDWISQQSEAVKQGVDGSEIRLQAAKNLRKQLELIKEGEHGYDIFVRWKPLHEQPVGWNPDLNDGVRLNIRPFMLAEDVGKKGAGILRAKPNINWNKDRGKDLASAPWYHLGLEYGGKEGDRINEHHLTLAEKREAREEFARSQADQAEEPTAERLL